MQSAMKSSISAVSTRVLLSFSLGACSGGADAKADAGGDTEIGTGGELDTDTDTDADTVMTNRSSTAAAKGFTSAR